MAAACERLLGSLHRGLLDCMLIISEEHLRSVVTEYQAHYTTARPRANLMLLAPL
jgi:putative transposase